MWYWPHVFLEETACLEDRHAIGICSSIVASLFSQDPLFTTMVEPHTTTSFKNPKTPESVDDEVAKTRKLFGEMKQPLQKLNVHSSPSLVRTILISELFHRMYLMGYMTEQRNWLHWMVQ